MANRAEELAQKFEAINQEVVATVEACPAEQWQAQCANEDWPICVGASHIADSYRYVRDMVESFAEGRGFPVESWEQIHEGNAKMAEANGRATREEVLAALTANAERTAGYLRSLDDEKLDRTAMVSLLDREVNTQQLIEMLLIGHPRGHLDSMERGIEASRAGRP